MITSSVFEQSILEFHQSQCGLLVDFYGALSMSFFQSSFSFYFLICLAVLSSSMYLALLEVEARANNEAKAEMMAHTLLRFEVATKAMRLLLLSTILFLTEATNLSILIDLMKLEDAYY